MQVSDYGGAHPDSAIGLLDSARLDADRRRQQSTKSRPRVREQVKGPAFEAGSGPRLLVIDDERNLAVSMTRFLNDEGFRAEFVLDGGAGLAAARAANWDAIVLDLKMPRVDGFAVLRELRQARIRVPVLVLTGFPSVTSAVDAMKLGASDYRRIPAGSPVGPGGSASVPSTRGLGTTMSPRVQAALDMVTTVALLGAAVTVVWGNVRSVSLQRATSVVPASAALLDLRGVELKGSLSATVGILEFSDFECPFCGTFARTTLDEIDRAFVVPGRVMIAFRNLPVEKIHVNAFPAAKAARCASSQGRFWEMHDQLFLEPRELDAVSLRRKALGAGLDPHGYDQCMSSDQAAAEVKEDVDLAARLNLRGTPVFLLGRLEPGLMLRVSRIISGAKPFAEFKETLDRLLER